MSMKTGAALIAALVVAGCSGGAERPAGEGAATAAVQTRDTTSTPDSAGMAGMENGNGIASSAAKIVNASDIEVQRAAYEDLSKQMMEKVKATGVENGELYVQFCPMAFNDKGASWLSSNKEIRNPYFGEKMMSCGETRETIQ